MNDPSDEAQPRLEFWSTRASIDSEIPSVTAIIETALAVAIYWWAAVRFETYLPLLLSAAVAPLVLLRSDESVKLGARWFKQWEANRWEDDRTYSQLEAPQRRRVLTITAIGTALAALTAFFIADHFNQYFETDNVFWRDISIESLSAAGASAMVIGGALVLMLGGTGAIAAALAVGVEVTIFAVVIVAGIPAASVLTIAIVISEIISGAAVGTRAGAGAGPIGVSRKVALVSKGTPVTGRTLIYDLLFLNSLFYAPFVLGLGLSVFILSLAVRVTATLCHIPAGLRDLPRNFRRLTLCTSPKQTPELIPGLANNETQFSLDYIRQRFRTGRSGDLYDKIFAIILFPPAMLLWFFPGWLYRVTLKSTSWFWWPLAFLSRPPRLSNNPTWLYRKLIRAKLTLYLAYLCIATFVFVSVWRTTENGPLPKNPFLNIVGYAFSIDWSSTLWQLLAVAGAVLSIAIVYFVSLNFQKYQTAIETKDDALTSEALSHFFWIEILCRGRLLLFLTYWVIVGFHAILVLNAKACWFDLPPFILSLAESLYRAYLPVSQCVR